MNWASRYQTLLAILPTLPPYIETNHLANLEKRRV